jgi:ethanolamine ammonia-lyase small subunit
MKPPTSRLITDLKDFTPARVGLGRAGASLTTKAWLDFALDHARARDAVHGAFDASSLVAGLNDLGFDAIEVSSRASKRSAYLKRPDLGRMLDVDSQRRLASHRNDSSQLAIVIGDGLSPAAVQAHAVHLVRSLIPQLGADGIEIGHAVVAAGARVALGDEIGVLLGVRMLLVLIGERPGLSASDSLGAYLTFAPRPGRTDAERNCVSNIHGAGLSYDEAAMRISWLIREGLARQITGVALKDESGGQTSRHVIANSN